MTEPTNVPDLPSGVDRREFIQTSAAAAALLAFGDRPRFPFALDDRALVYAEIPKQHDATVKMIQEWIALPSIAAEDRNYPAGPEYMAKLLRDAGCQTVELVPTKGKAGVYGTLDSGAKNWLAIYLMYDVKQYDPAEWSSPPLEGRLVDKPGVGKILVGRGATNSKGPEAACLAALNAFKAAGKKLPVNIVFVCEGEEEIASPNFHEIVFSPKVEPLVRKCQGVMIPLQNQTLDGALWMNMGSKGVVELELVSSGEKWGRGPKLDIHSSNEANVDSPAWHLVQALNTLVEADGHTPAVEGFFGKVKPLSPELKAMLAAAIPNRSEAGAKKTLGVEHFYKDEPWPASLERLVSQPTINIEGLVGGYTGPGGKTILPHRAVAKIDMRLVPDMTKDGTVELLKAHLAKHGFADIEVNVSGGYDPTSTDPNSKFVKAQMAAYEKSGVEPMLWPRLAGSWPGVTFTGAPLSLPATHYGLGFGTGAHAPDEYMVVVSSKPEVAGLDGAVKSYVDLFFELA